VFDLYDNERLTEWRKFRDSLEISQTPFEDVAVLWAQAPFVSPYLKPNNPKTWPDPWHLILDDRYDELAIALGMLYTLKLTQRFMNSKFEIHTSMFPQDKEPRYLLVVDDSVVLNMEYKCVIDYKQLENIKTNIVWSATDSL
jgi:hypothetical protein